MFLQRLKRSSSLKHYMRSVGLKEKTLRGERPLDGNGASMLKVLRWQYGLALQCQTRFDRKGPSMANAEAFESKESIARL
jgi:hypothetical protein